MNRQEIIDTAIRLEEDGRAFYLQAASEATAPAVQEVLRSLATDEENHIRWIRETLGPEKSARELNQETYARVKGVFAAAPEEAKEAFRAAREDLEPLRLALEREREAWKAYEKWAAETEDSSLAEILRKLAEVERFHERLLENTILYLEDPASYHQQEEGWLLDGG